MDRNNLDMDVIKHEFDILKEYRLKIKQTILKIGEIKKVIKENYKQYITEEKDDYFGLDSFHFQNKAIELEHKNVLELYHFIDNRIYGDYYKLFTTISNSLHIHLHIEQLESIKELKHLKNYPVYKDLEPLKKYDFDLINQIHQDIIIVLENSREIFKENVSSISRHKKQLELGMNIDNYIINQEFMNMNIQMKNKKHENYLSVYHKYHAEWLKKYLQKITLFFDQIRHHKSKHTIQKDKDDILIIDMNQPSSPESDKEPTNPVPVLMDVSLTNINDGFTLVTRKRNRKQKKKSN